jgi:hypothetical protein
MLPRSGRLEEATRRHEQATGKPAVPGRPGDHELYRLLRESDRHPSSNGSG